MQSEEAHKGVADGPQPVVDDTIFFTVGVTNLKELASARGLIYEADLVEERIKRHDGTVIIRAHLKPANMRGPKRKDPTVWLRSIRYHTYHGKVQDTGAVYLAHDDEVQNIIDLKFAVRETPPRRAVRRSA